MNAVIKAVMVEPNSPARTVLVENGPEYMASILGGKFCETDYWADGTVVLTNPDMTPNEGEPNRMIVEDNQPVDIVFGAFIILERGNFGGYTSLSDEHIEHYLSKFDTPDAFKRNGNNLYCEHTEPSTDI